MSLAYPLSNILAELVVGMPNLEAFVWDLPWAMDEGLWEALKPGMHPGWCILCRVALTLDYKDICPHLRTLGVFCNPGSVPQHHVCILLRPDAAVSDTHVDERLCSYPQLTRPR
jgi:hypothetical protein